MALPPKGDPRRPLYLAIRSTRMLAIFFLLFGIFGAAALFIPRGMSSRAQTLITILTLMAYIGPGAAYLVFSIYLKQLRFWAVVGALVLASLQLAMGAIITIVIVIAAVSRPLNQFILMSLAIMALVGVAIAQLIYHLAKSFDAIKYISMDEQRGFEPINMAIPINNPPVIPSLMPEENNPAAAPSSPARESPQ